MNGTDRMAVSWRVPVGALEAIRSLASGAAALAVVTLASAAAADAARPVVDRAVVRFFAPETGGAERPRFVTERSLAFQARLEMMAEKPEGIGQGYDERSVRIALDRDIAEELLASLAEKLIRGTPMSRRPSDADLARIRDEIGAAFYERLGGRDRVEQAARAEGFDPSEVEGLLRRQALATYYVDRTVAPVLEVSEEQLREVFRTAAHPFRGRPFFEVQTGLRRWFLLERVRAAENAFMQGARARLAIVVIP